MSARLDLDAVRAVADRCGTLARLVSYLDIPGREESKVRESITYHLTVAHQTCPGRPICRAPGLGASVRCLLLALHDGQHESRLMFWSD